MSAEKFLIFYGWVIALGGAGGIGAIWAGVKMNVVKGGVDDSRGVDKILMPGTEST